MFVLGCVDTYVLLRLRVKNRNLSATGSFYPRLGEQITVSLRGRAH